MSSHSGLSKNQLAPHPINELFPASTYSPALTESVFRRVLRQCAAAIVYSRNFDTADASVLEHVSHMMQSYMNAICIAAKMNCEVAGRTVTIPADVWLALINMGHDVSSLPQFLRETMSNGTVVIPPPKIQPAPTSSNPLRIGRARPHPQHVNEFLPPFPDPHTYIRTEISGEPDTSYERVRKMAAKRKRNTEKSLVDFMLRVHPRTSLFREYEERVKEEARRAMHDRERQKEARRSARRQARAAERIKRTVGDADSIMPDQLTEEDFLETSNNEKMEEDDPQSGSDDEIDFELEETETSLILRRLPSFCSVLDPSLESRPYLSALVSEELQQDDDTSEVTSAPLQNNQATTQTTDEQTYDNAFLRPPRMPSKVDFMEY